MSANKDLLRSKILTSQVDANHQKSIGKIAEKLKGIEPYRTAKQIFAAPAPILQQIRINALFEGKKLIMPGPGLKDGFFLLKPFTVPIRDISLAVTYKGLAKHGQLLKDDELAGLKIDLLVTDALALDEAGCLLGDGQGFFDLTHAVLSSYGAVSDTAKVIAVMQDAHLLERIIPPDPWDVFVDGIVTPQGHYFFDKTKKAGPRIYWEALSKKRIKKISPLWKLSHKKSDL